MKPDGTLPRLQDLATCPYSEPDQSIPCPTSYFPHVHHIIIFPSTLGSSKWFLSHWSPHQISVCTFPVIRTCHMPRTSHISCLYHSSHIVLAAPIISSPPYSHASPSSPRPSSQISNSATYSQTPLA